METTAEVQKQPLTTASLFNRDDVKKKFQEMLGKKAQGFITSVLQITASNALLSKADPMSIYNAAAVAATLDLPLNNNLGFAYIIPYNQKYQDNNGEWKSKQVAQFQLGYKGFIQLAQRSGQFKTISATPIYEGQIAVNNPLTGIVFDFDKKSETVIGYAAFFQLTNGFYKTLYMTIDDLKKHGVKYSKTFGNKNGLWNTDFDSMATKTVIKLLLSKYAPLSIEMQKAVTTDQATINNEDGTDVSYVDHEIVEAQPINKEHERITLLIGDCKNIEDVELLQETYPEIDVKLFEARKAELKGGKNE
jgi:recombination protein RecT